jgi:signal recognition particle receptor subunit beta
MAYSNDSEPFPTAVKVLIAGGFGVGKTTFIGSASEIEPLRTEELITSASIGTDDLEGLDHKSTTTVAFDFGRVTFPSQHVLYMFGTPGQERFWFMWDELCEGALGAIVLVDPRRLESSFPAVDFFERRGIHFLVAINQFEGAFRYEPEEVRAALKLGPRTPVMISDARDSRAATSVLVCLVQSLIDATTLSPTT